MRSNIKHTKSVGEGVDWKILEKMSRENLTVYAKTS